MHLLMILVDGIGIAPKGHFDPIRTSSRFLSRLHDRQAVALPGGGWVVPTCADLGVPGLPQSATGHTALITGVNAAKVLGRHFPGFPTRTLTDLIEADNLLKRLTKAGYRAVYVNAYRPIMQTTRLRRLRSATTVAAQSNGQRLMETEDILSGHALHHDFTNRLLVRNGEDLPIFTPRRSGQILASLTEKADFTLFEYFLTDMTGHAQDDSAAREEMTKLDGFVEGLLESIDLSRTHILICSDHGNLENLSVKTHTRNPVPTMIWGPRAENMISHIHRIEHIASQVLRLFRAAHRL